MHGRDLDEELQLERLRDLQSRRRAREQSDYFSLIERAAGLAMTVAGTAYSLIHGPQAPSITAIAGGLALMRRKRG